jgi:hypothetical protein
MYHVGMLETKFAFPKKKTNWKQNLSMCMAMYVHVFIYYLLTRDMWMYTCVCAWFYTTVKGHWHSSITPYEARMKDDSCAWRAATARAE